MRSGASSGAPVAVVTTTLRPRVGSRIQNAISYATNLYSRHLWRLDLSKVRHTAPVSRRFAYRVLDLDAANGIEDATSAGSSGYSQRLYRTEPLEGPGTARHGAARR